MVRKLIAGLFIFGGAMSANMEAQGSARLLSDGVSAYRALEYETAARLLRGALAVSGSEAITGAARSEPLMYLGASDFFLGNTEPARKAFVEALASNPRHRADTMLFPPEITRAFDAARSLTAFVLLRAPGDTTIVAGSEAVNAVAFVSAPHHMDVSLRRGTGDLVRSLYRGSVKDSVVITWNGMDEADRAPVDGQLLVHVESTSPSGELQVTAAPLVVTKIPVDTLVPPPQPRASAPTPRHVTRPALTALSVGVLTGAAAIFIPQAISRDGKGMQERYVVGGALSAAGIAGFFMQWKKSGASSDTAGAAAAIAEWNREVAAVTAENARRRGGQKLRITSGVSSAGGLEER